MNKRVIVAVTGASGSIYGLRLLEKLKKQATVETHLVLSRAGERTSFLELGKVSSDWKALADYHYSQENIGCGLASGSFRTHSMVIAPCSIHTMSAIAGGISSNLIVRAADVCLKERRKLVLMVRETPFHLGHLRNMCALAEMGAVIAPPVPGFYHQPKSIDDLVNHSVDRVLDLLDLPDQDTFRWQEGGDEK